MSERIALLTDDERAWLEQHRLETGRPLPPLWYEQFVRFLVESQQSSATLLAAAADSYRVIAAEFTKLADVAAGLAESVPSGDQAAADLGTAVDRHMVNNVHTVLSRDVMRLGDDVAALRQFVEDDRRRAADERRRILEALDAHDTTTRPEKP
jgi:hypothetical protein